MLLYLTVELGALMSYLLTLIQDSWVELLFLGSSLKSSVHAWLPWSNLHLDLSVYCPLEFVFL